VAISLEKSARKVWMEYKKMKDSEKRPQFKQVLTYATLLLVGAGIGVWAVIARVATPIPIVANVNAPALLSPSNPGKPPSVTPPNLNNGIAIAATIPGNTNFISDAVEKTGPAVVRINASRTVTANANEQQFPELFADPFFRDFFGDSLPNSKTLPKDRVERGTGSGFIINKEGDIITNAHVVEGADKVSVVLKDGRKLEGKVLGRDQLTDIAVVKVNAPNLPIVSIGSSQILKPGEWAIAIGNPLGLDNTVTAGIISALGRSSGEIGVIDKRVRFIQTDAAINPGNSGGPLLNQKGEVVAVNTAIIRGAQGLGFAIPIETAQRIAKQLIAKGNIDRAYLGIQMVTLDAATRQEINENANLGIKVTDEVGVLVTAVVPNSPAEASGVKAGDVIFKVDGQDVKTADGIQQAVEIRAIGDNLKLELRRSGKPLVLSVKAGKLPQRSPS
jgi:serine protease Do